MRKLLALATGALATILLSALIILVVVAILALAVKDYDGVLAWMVNPVQEFFTESQTNEIPPDKTPPPVENPATPKSSVPSNTALDEEGCGVTVDADGRIIIHGDPGPFAPLRIVKIQSYGHNKLMLEFNDDTKGTLCLGEPGDFREYDLSYSHPWYGILDLAEHPDTLSLIQEEINKTVVYWLDIFDGDLFIRTGGEAERIGVKKAIDKYAKDEIISAEIDKLVVLRSQFLLSPAPTRAPNPDGPTLPHEPELPSPLFPLAFTPLPDNQW